MLDINNFFFMSPGCAGDYLNKYYHIQNISPTAISTADELKYIDFIKNIDKVDFDKREYIPYQNVTVVKRGYCFNAIDKELGVDEKNTFGIKFSSSDNKQYEFYYRHYEYNEENIDKINRRVLRFKTTNRIPFFIISFNNKNKLQTTSIGYRILVMNEFLKKLDYNYKLFVTSEKTVFNLIKDKKYIMLTDKMHIELADLIDQHFKKYW